MQAHQPVTVTGLNSWGIMEVVSGLVCERSLTHQAVMELGLLDEKHALRAAERSIYFCLF